MPTTSASARKSSRTPSRPTASCATRSAGCSARWHISSPATQVAHADMPELERLMLHQLAGQAAIVRKAYAEFDYKTVVATLVGLHEHRTVGVLFRHPQGHAVLRSAVVAGAQGRADHDRHHLRCDPEMAGAGVELHHRRGVADVPAGRRTVGAPDAVPGPSSRRSATTRWPRNGRPSATSAASSPARSNSNAPPRTSALRWRPRRSSMSPTRRSSTRCSMSTSPRSASPRMRW